MEFKLDVSRVYREKEGYEVGGYNLNTSFATETLTPERFVEDVIKEGWPYTMVHLKRSPEETGAVSRGVYTPKHIENFVSQQVLTFDDDRGTNHVVEDWLNDPFFKRYGFAFVESSSSTPEAQKGHAIFILETPVTDPVLYKNYLKAGCYKWVNRVDWLVNIDRTIYNAYNRPVYLIGKTLPNELYEREVVLPWQTNEDIKLQDAYDKRNKNVVDAGLPGDKAQEAYLNGFVDWMIDHIANKSKGENRNIAIYWAGRTVAGIQDTDWCKTHLWILADVEDRVIEACRTNGYLAEYANNNPDEIRRIYNIGLKVGGSELAPPVKQELKTKTRIHTALNTVEPALSEHQKQQAIAATERIIEELAEERAWLRFNRYLIEHGIQIGYPEPIINHFKFGYRRKSINEDTGEILLPALTVPFYMKENVVSVEYRCEDGSFDYEGGVQLYSVPPMFNEDTHAVIVLPDSLLAVNYYLAGSNSFSVYGLPHKSFDTDLVLPDKDLYCLFDDTTDLEQLELLDKVGARFVKVRNVEKLIKALNKTEIERIVSRGKRLNQVI